MQIQKLLVLGLALVSLVALGHTQLSSSIPADDAALAAAPDQLQLTFSEPVTLTAVSIKDSQGSPYDLGALPTATQRDFAIPMPALPAGSYVVGWRAVGADTHVVSGEIHFAIAAH